MTQQFTPNSLPPFELVVKDAALKVEWVVKNLSKPTSMIFLPDGSILVTEKAGKAKVITVSSANSTSTNYSTVTTIAKFNVSTEGERGLLGTAFIEGNHNLASEEIKSGSSFFLGSWRPSIATSSSSTNSAANGLCEKLDNNDVSNSSNNIASGVDNNDIVCGENGDDDYLFFYLTEAGPDDIPRGNMVYRYDWNDTTKSISNKTLILQLPAQPGPDHNGGKMISDSDGHLFIVIGDLRRNATLQNNKQPPFYLDDTSVILKINSDGSPAHSNPFLNLSETNPAAHNLGKYYAYGIRNSFGLAIDPVTGMLWDTENGPRGYDEINLVRPGFNSGWEKVYGPIERRNITKNDLVNLGNFSTYADPVLSWRPTIAVTDIEFFNSTMLGDLYQYNLFVADFNTGSLYYFQLNETRTGLIFDNPAVSSDLVAVGERVRDALVFAKGFVGGITDIATGPDGYLYILTLAGNIYRIMPV
jgi:glucose/arabinose dehydrogenase